VASVLQLKKGFIFGNVNCEDIHPEIEKLIASEKIPLKTIEKPFEIIVKASFGFGDVNAVVVFRKVKE
jgi:3-oxoacyl-(acyl-carrier-protein) synthase